MLEKALAVLFGEELLVSLFHNTARKLVYSLVKHDEFAVIL